VLIFLPAVWNRWPNNGLIAANVAANKRSANVSVKGIDELEPPNRPTFHVRHELILEVGSKFKQHAASSLALLKSGDIQPNALQPSAFNVING
jgi:hypothetical protein